MSADNPSHESLRLQYEQRQRLPLQEGYCALKTALPNQVQAGSIRVNQYCE